LAQRICGLVHNHFTHCAAFPAYQVIVQLVVGAGGDVGFAADLRALEVADAVQHVNTAIHCRQADARMDAARASQYLVCAQHAPCPRHGFYDGDARQGQAVAGCPEGDSRIIGCAR